MFRVYSAPIALLKADLTGGLSSNLLNPSISGLSSGALPNVGVWGQFLYLFCFESLFISFTGPALFFLCKGIRALL